jgi:deoxyribonuclease-4
MYSRARTKTSRDSSNPGNLSLSNKKQHNKSIKKTKKKLSSTSTSSSNLILGCHASITPSVISGLQYAQSIGANAAQIFLGSNLSASMKTKTKFTPENIQEIRVFLTTSRMILIIHTIYLLNLCKAPPTSGRIKWMHANIWHDMEYGAKLGAKCVVLHLGSRKEIPIQEALKNLISNINHIIRKAPPGIQLALETAAGAGYQVGYTLEELAVIWNGVKHNGNNKIGICIDTAHIFVAGEDISTVEGIKDYMRRFNSLIGWKHITNFHLNDSRYPLGSRRDEHRGIGSGLVYTKLPGMEALRWIKNFCQARGIPMILETHGAAHPDSEGTRKGAHGYEWEIGLIRGL